MIYRFQGRKFGEITASIINLKRGIVSGHYCVIETSNPNGIKKACTSVTGDELILTYCGKNRYKASLSPDEKPISTGLIIFASIIITFFIMICAYVVFLELTQPIIVW